MNLSSKSEPFLQEIRSLLIAEKKSYQNAFLALQSNTNSSAKQQDRKSIISANNFVRQYEFWIKVFKSLRRNPNCISQLKVSVDKLQSLRELLDQHSSIVEEKQKREEKAKTEREVSMEEKLHCFSEDCSSNFFSLASNFFSGEPVDCYFFLGFCQIIQYKEEEIVDDLQVSPSQVLQVNEEIDKRIYCHLREYCEELLGYLEKEYSFFLKMVYAKIILLDQTDLPKESVEERTNTEANFISETTERLTREIINNISILKLKSAFSHTDLSFNNFIVEIQKSLRINFQNNSSRKAIKELSQETALQVNSSTDELLKDFIFQEDTLQNIHDFVVGKIEKALGTSLVIDTEDKNSKKILNSVVFDIANHILILQSKQNSSFKFSDLTVSDSHEDLRVEIRERIFEVIESQKTISCKVIKRYLNYLLSKSKAAPAHDSVNKADRADDPVLKEVAKRCPDIIDKSSQTASSQAISKNRIARKISSTIKHGFNQIKSTTEDQSTNILYSRESVIQNLHQKHQCEIEYYLLRHSCRMVIDFIFDLHATYIPSLSNKDFIARINVEKEKIIEKFLPDDELSASGSERLANLIYSAIKAVVPDEAIRSEFTYSQIESNAAIEFHGIKDISFVDERESIPLISIEEFNAVDNKLVPTSLVHLDSVKNFYAGREIPRKEFHTICSTLNLRSTDLISSLRVSRIKLETIYKKTFLLICFRKRLNVEQWQKTIGWSVKVFKQPNQLKIVEDFVETCSSEILLAKNTEQSKEADYTWLQFIIKFFSGESVPFPAYRLICQTLAIPVGGTYLLGHGNIYFSKNTSQNYSAKSSGKNAEVRNDSELISYSDCEPYTRLPNEFACQLPSSEIRKVKDKLDLLQSVSLLIQERERKVNDSLQLKFKDKIEYFSVESTTLDFNSCESFFSGENVSCECFFDICKRLNTSGIKIIDQDYLSTSVILVPEVRSRHSSHIKNSCGTLRILNVSKPIELDSLYVDLNILKEPQSFSTKDLSELVKEFGLSEKKIERFILGDFQERVSGIEAIQKFKRLMILGKPGSGKSTFMQFLAIRCINGDFEADRIPVFIRLKSLSEKFERSMNFDVLTHIAEQFYTHSFELDRNMDIKKTERIIQKILKYGRALILLDGLDEISEEHSADIVEKINDFCERFSKNKFIITCRVAAQEYRFRNFRDVEIADFDDKQIETFARNWFLSTSPSQDLGLRKTDEFMANIRLACNKQIYELSVTPILLTLTCLVFQETSGLPSNRAYLYEDGLNILLGKWDEFKNIKRASLYRDLDIDAKKNLLSQIASKTFLENNYLLQKNELLVYITNFFEFRENTEFSAISSNYAEIVLKSLEAQHGLLVERARNIYSFSHLTFQEYFTARYFISNSNLGIWKVLVDHIGERRWREVFLLTSDLFDFVRNPFPRLYLMIQKLLDIASSDESFERILGWINGQFYSLRNETVPAYILRAFLFEIAVFLNDSISNRRFDLRRFVPYSSNDAFRNFFDSKKFEIINDIRSFLQDKVDLEDTKYYVDILPTLAYHEFKSQTMIKQKTLDVETWWELNRIKWIRLSEVISVCRNFATIWSFSTEQKLLLEKYYDGCNILVSCLNNSPGLETYLREELLDAVFNININKKVVDANFHFFGSDKIEDFQSTQTGKKKRERLQLYRDISSLATPQFEELVFILDVPPANLSSASAPLGVRVAELIKWAESSIGCGLKQVEEAFDLLRIQ